MAFILIETADRETGVLKFKTKAEAQEAMYDAFRETLENEGLDYVGSTNCYIHDRIQQDGYYEDECCGLNPEAGWYNRRHGGHLDWLIEEVKMDDVIEEAIEHYWDIIHSVMKMKATEARDMADKEEDYDSYNSG